MPTNHHEITQGETTIELTVYWEYGECSDPGDYPYRPPYYEPDHVTDVYDEDGKDITDWACKHVGESDLINKRHTEIKEEIQIPNQ